MNAINTLTANVCAKVQTELFSIKNAAKNESGITAIEYAIMGVAMASALYYIFSTGGFLQALNEAWGTMRDKIGESEGILRSAIKK